MAGKNPYVKEAEYQLPEKSYKLTFVEEESGRRTEIQVDPTKIPYDREGLPGSILDIAEGCEVAIDHACGGVVACSTCHIKVLEGAKSCNEASEAEEDMLDSAPGVGPNSRLGCQCVPNGTSDVVILIPRYGRNIDKHQH